MVNGKKVFVILPAFNAAKTLQRTLAEVPLTVVDDVILTDDASTDATVQLARQLGIRHIIEHKTNLGYGENQKTCYTKALSLDADIIVMLHPDYQYTPRLIPSMAYLLADNVFDVVIASRILGNGALRGGMPLYKYVSNRVLTFIQNVCTGAKLSEYHSGYRAFSSRVLKAIDLQSLSSEHIFDNEILSEILLRGFQIGEITCPTHYHSDSSSLNFFNSLRYGLGVLRVSARHALLRFARSSRRSSH